MSTDRYDHDDVLARVRRELEPTEEELMELDQVSRAMRGWPAREYQTDKTVLDMTLSDRHYSLSDIQALADGVRLVKDLQAMTLFREQAGPEQAAGWDDCIQVCSEQLSTWREQHGHLSPGPESLIRLLSQQPGATS